MIAVKPTHTLHALLSLMGCAMGQITIRQIPQSLLDEVKQRARALGVSQQEIWRRAVQDGLSDEARRRRAFDRLMEIRKGLPPSTADFDSTEEIRKDRDSRRTDLC